MTIQTPPTMKKKETTRPMTWTEIVKKHLGVSPVDEKKPRLSTDDIRHYFAYQSYKFTRDRRLYNEICVDLIHWPYKYLNCIYKSGNIILATPEGRGKVSLISKCDSHDYFDNLYSVIIFKTTYDNDDSIVFDESHSDKQISVEDLMLMNPFSPVLKNIMDYLKCPEHLYDDFVNLVNSLLEKYSHKPFSIKEWVNIIYNKPTISDNIVIHRDSKTDIEVSYNVSLKNVFISFKKPFGEIKVETPIYFDFYVSPDEYKRWLLDYFDIEDSE